MGSGAVVHTCVLYDFNKRNKMENIDLNLNPGSPLDVNGVILRDPKRTSSSTMGRARIGRTDKTEHELPLMLPSYWVKSLTNDRRGGTPQRTTAYAAHKLKFMLYVHNNVDII